MSLLASLLACAGTTHAQPAPEPGSPAAPVIDVEVQGPPSPVADASDDTTARFTLREADMARPGVTLAELLSEAPGVEVTRSGGSTDFASISVRGSTSAQLPVYLGGVRLADEITGTVDLSTLPSWMLHRIELHRGHAGMQADRLGVSGALMLVPRLARTASARVHLGMSSFGGREARASGTVGDGKAAASLAIRYRRGRGNFDFVDDRGTAFDPTDDRNRQRRNADHEQVDAWSTSSLKFRAGRIDLLVHGFHREAGVPGLQLIGSRRARSSVHRALAAASANLACYGGATDCRLLLDTGLLRSRYRLSDPLGEAGPDSTVVSRGARVSQRIRVAFQPTAHTSVWIGGSFEGGQLQQRRGTAPLRHSARQVLRPELAVSSQPLDTLQLSAVGAVNCHTTRAAAGAQSCGVLEPVGRLGVRWQAAPELAVFANGGRYLRVPTLGELFGITATVRGNDDLRPETGNMLDVGVNAEWNADGFGVFSQLVGYARWAEDLIVYRRSSLGAVTPYNALSARVLGAEGAVGMWWGPYLRARASMSLMDPRDTAEDTLTNDLLPLRSRRTAHLRATVTTPPWPQIGLSSADLALSYRHRSNRIADPAGLITLPAQHLLDLELGMHLHRRKLALRGRIANMLDSRNVDLLGYPLPGRAYHGSMEMQW